MPAFTLTISVASLTEMTDMLCSLNGYQTTIDGVTNPETRALFAKRMVIEDLKRKVRDYRNHQAVVTAQAAVSTVDPDIT